MEQSHLTSSITLLKSNRLFTSDRSITIMRTSDVEELVAAIKSIPGDPEELLDIEGVQLLLGGGRGKKVSKTTINNWRREGILVPIKIGRGRNAAVRFRRQDVLESIRKIEAQQRNRNRN